MRRHGISTNEQLRVASRDGAQIGIVIEIARVAIASIAAMATFVLLSSQIAVTTPTPVVAAYEQVEIA